MICSELSIILRHRTYCTYLGVGNLKCVPVRLENAYLQLVLTYPTGHYWHQVGEYHVELQEKSVKMAQETLKDASKADPYGDGDQSMLAGAEARKMQNMWGKK